MRRDSRVQQQFVDYPAVRPERTERLTPNEAINYTSRMWWILFTAVDLYIGLIILDVMAKSGSIPPQKLPRLQVAKKITIGAIAVLGLVFLAKLSVRYM
jgi:hypothetical protein